MKTCVIKPEDRIGMSRDEAAEYIGVGVDLFDRMVEDARMPKPKCAGKRRIWSKKSIEKAFDLLPEDGEDVLSSGSGRDPWTELVA